MNKAQTIAAIKAISPFITAKWKADYSEWRVSVNPAFFQQFEGMSYTQANERAEAIAAYCQENDEAAQVAETLFHYNVKPHLIP